jgi:hypothetical protein
MGQLSAQVCEMVAAEVYAEQPVLRQSYAAGDVQP